MGNFVLLLPPSERKVLGGDIKKLYKFVYNLKEYNHFIFLSNQRRFIIDKLKKVILSKNVLTERIFGLKGKNLDNAVETLLNILNLETMPAIERYRGVMYKAINYKGFSEGEKKIFNENTIIIDGLFGILKPQDLIPYYKLKITSKFGEIDITKFWNLELKNFFSKLFKDKIIIDLLPNSHKKVINNDLENANIISIKFARLKDEKIIEEGHNSKKLKGEFVKFICSKNNPSILNLKEFVHSEGYKFNEKFSKSNEFFFTKY